MLRRPLLTLFCLALLSNVVRSQSLSISDMWVDGPAHRLTLTGNFATIPDHVVVGDSIYPIESWTRTTVTARIADTGSGASGKVKVTSGSLASNQRTLSILCVSCWYHLITYRGGEVYDVGDSYTYGFQVDLSSSPRAIEPCSYLESYRVSGGDNIDDTTSDYSGRKREPSTIVIDQDSIRFTLHSNMPGGFGQDFAIAFSDSASMYVNFPTGGGATISWLDFAVRKPNAADSAGSGVLANFVTDGIFSLPLSEDEVATLDIFNIVGANVAHIEDYASDSPISLSGLAKGTYAIRIVTSHGVEFVRFQYVAD